MQVAEAVMPAESEGNRYEGFIHFAQELVWHPAGPLGDAAGRAMQACRMDRLEGMGGGGSHLDACISTDETTKEVI